MSEFPHGWSTRVIEEICDIHDYRRIPLSSEERRERKGPYPYYGANNIQDRIDDFIFDFDAVLIAEDGGYYDEHEYRDIAQYATGKYWVNNHAHILTGKPGLDTRFLYYALVRKNICPWINTGTRSKLNQSDLKQIELLVPPLPEQKKIAEILSGIDNEISRFKDKIEALAFLKKSTANILVHQEGFPHTPLHDVLGNGGNIQIGLNQKIKTKVEKYDWFNLLTSKKDALFRNRPAS